MAFVSVMKKQILVFIFCLICTLVNGDAKHFYSVFDRNDLPVFSRPFFATLTADPVALKSAERMLDDAMKSNSQHEIYQNANNAGYYNLLNGDFLQALKFLQIAVNHKPQGKEAGTIMAQYAFALDVAGRHEQAFTIYNELLEKELANATQIKAYVQALAGLIFLQHADTVSAKPLLSKALQYFSANNFLLQQYYLYERMGDINLVSKNFNSASANYLQQLKYAAKLNNKTLQALATRNLGLCYFKRDDYLKAASYFKQSLDFRNNVLLQKLLKDTYLKIVTISSFNNDFESADHYHELYRQLKANETVVRETAALQAEKEKILFLLSKSVNNHNNMVSQQEYELSQQLTTLEIERQNKEKALEELTLAEAQKKLKELELDKIAGEKIKQEAELAKKELQISRQKEFRNILLGISGLIVLGIIFLINRYRLKRKSLEQLRQAHQELRQAHEQLKQTQQQLIQSEKMASLGQLTAGIAHEIQNPLNFVNNFSTLSMDMIEDYLKNKDETLLEELKSNLKRINHHGGRVSSIVKGMLLHSRNKTTEKELSDINLLVDESLALAFHGKKSTEADFYCHIEKNYDVTAPAIKVFPQELRRVIINLVNNAFYAVHERATKSNANKDETKYKPQVSVATHVVNQFLEITITDNGTGIPDAIKDKIYNPFFTSKPTGKGTGLGLSVSFDIIEKQHGGKLKFESEQGVGTVFTISLPLIAPPDLKQNNGDVKKSVV